MLATSVCSCFWLVPHSRGSPHCHLVTSSSLVLRRKQAKDTAFLARSLPHSLAASRLPQSAQGWRMDRKKKILVKNSVEECQLPSLADSRTTLHVTTYDIYSLGREDSQVKEKSHSVGPCGS
jgi:hypothetical protein